jgi:two-component system NtrC family sensor kinase
LLAGNGAAFNALASPAELATLRAGLERYAGLMGEYGRLGPDEASRADRLESSIRAAGKSVLNAAEGMARTERRLIQSALDRFRLTLLFAIAFLSLLMTGLGWVLSKTVVRPLRHMGSCVEAVSAGKLDKLPMPSEDREVVSITRAFNHMLGELELRQKRLLRSEKLASLGTMLSGVAHELNNPLSNISSSCQILMEEADGADPEHRRELLAQIDEQTVRARNIVRSLLDFARDRESKREPVPLAGLVGETLRFLRGQVPPGVSVSVEVPEDIVVPGDRQRLQQAFLNLLKNALEAVGSGGRISIRASVRRLAACRTEG